MKKFLNTIAISLCALIMNSSALAQTPEPLTTEQMQLVRDSFSYNIEENAAFTVGPKIIDGSTTFSYLGEGQHQYQLFTNKKPYYIDKNGDKQYFHETWRFFTDNYQSQITADQQGYQFQIPVNSTPTFRGSSLQIGSEISLPQSTIPQLLAESQKAQYWLKNIYPNIDYLFEDTQSIRRQSIIINNDISNGQETIFWDEIILPHNATVSTSENETITNSTSLFEEKVIIEIGQDKIFLDPAVVFDSINNSQPQIIERKVILEQNILKIGLVLSPEYLSQDLQYPITIDPDIYACTEDTENELGILIPQCDLGQAQDFYTVGDFWTNPNNQNLLLGKGFSIGAQADRNHSAVLKFDLNNLPNDMELSAAWLQMYYESLEEGNHQDSVNLTPYIFTRPIPDNPANFHYIEWANNLQEVLHHLEYAFNSNNYGWLRWDISNLVEDWLDGNIENNGILIDYTRNNNFPNFLMQFHSSRNISNNSPHLKVRLQPDDGGRVDLAVLTRGIDGGDNNGGFLPAEEMQHSLIIENRGNVPSQNFTVKYYLAPQEIYDDQYMIGSLRLNGVTPNINSGWVNVEFNVPDSLPGDYKIYFWIDSEGEIAESNEANNTSFSRFTVLDEDVSDLTLEDDFEIEGQPSGAQVTSSQSISTVARYCNRDMEVSKRFGSHYYVSNDNQLSPDDTLILNIPETGSLLPFNFCRNLIQEVPLPQLQLGNYYLILFIDPDNLIPESNGENNTISSRFEIIPGGYCAGQCGNGNIPESEDLPDSDGDGIADLEERTGGGDEEIFNQPNGLFTSIAGRALSSDYPKPEVDGTKLDLSDVADGDPVNMRTGAFEFIQSDLFIKGRGFPIDIKRVYNSRLGQLNSRIGNGWEFSEHIFAYQNPNDNSVNIYKAGHMLSQFTTLDNQDFIAIEGDTSILYWDEGKLVYETIGGLKYQFDEQLTSQMSMLDKIIDKNGNITDYVYTYRKDIPLLTSIIDPSGRSVDFTYGDADHETLWDNVIAIDENSGSQWPQRVEYTYSETGDLIRVRVKKTYQGEEIWQDKRYLYGENSTLLEYTDPQGTILYNIYDQLGRVLTQSEHNPRIDAPNTSRIIYQFQYSDQANPNIANSAFCNTITNHKSENDTFQTQYCFSDRGLLIHKSNSLNQAHTWTYDENGMPASATDPTGATTFYNYDQRRRLTGEIFPSINNTQSAKVYSYEDNFNQVTSVVESFWPIDDIENKTSRITVVNQIDPENGNLLSTTDALGQQSTFTYDNFGNIISSTDKRGNTTFMQYDEGGNYLTNTEIEVTNADGETELISKQYIYDQRGNITTQIDANGNQSTYQYDSHDNLRSSVDALGHTTTYQYDIENNLILETDPLGRQIQYQYDTDIETSLLSKTYSDEQNAQSITESYTYDWIGNLTSSTDPRSTTTTYAYDQANRINQILTPTNTINITLNERGEKTSTINSLGQKTDYIYDARGNLLHTKQYLNQEDFIQTSTTYDGFSRAIQSTDGNGNTTTVSYDDLDRIVSQTDQLGNTTQNLYDENNNLIAIINPRALEDPTLANTNGHSISFQYDELNRLIKSTNAEDKVTKIYYDLNGNQTLTIDRQDLNGDSSEHQTSYQYDALNRLITSTDSYQNPLTYTYDAVGNILSETDRSGRITSHQYDYLNRKISTNDPLNNQTTYQYDPAGNILSITYPGNVSTQYQYDISGRKTSMTDESGNQFTYTYDSSNNLLSSIDRLDKTTTFNYDQLNRLIQETNHDNTSINYSYDNNGNILTQDHQGQITSYTYDELNRTLQITNPGNKTQSYTYDSNSNITSQTNGEQQQITYQYDALDRLITKQTPERNIVTYQYDNWDNLITKSENLQTITTAYDFKNRPTIQNIQFQEEPENIKTITNTYNPDDEILTTNDAANNEFTYSYDQRGLLHSISYQQQNLATYSYNPRGTVNEIQYGNGTSQQYQYDNLLRPLDISVLDNQGETLFQQQYTYDAEGNRLNLTENSRTISYSYDNLHQLTSADDNTKPGLEISLQYDQWGNRTQINSIFGTHSYIYDQNTNELQSLTENTHLQRNYTYDNNGSLINESTNRLNLQTKEIQYNWDSQQRLNTITYLDNTRSGNLPAAPERTLQYSYSDDGNRIKKQIQGRDNATVYYINNGLLVGIEFQETLTNPGKSIVQGIDQIAEITENQILYTHKDVLGSTIMITDQQANIVAQYAYDLFGSIIGKQEQKNKNSRYLYTGQEHDPESKLMYYNARYYNPALGRFISRDSYKGSSGDPLSRNRYIYVKNNPFKYNDPSGKNAAVLTSNPAAKLTQYNVRTYYKLFSIINTEIQGQKTLKQNQALLEYERDRWENDVLPRYRQWKLEQAALEEAVAEKQTEIFTTIYTKPAAAKPNFEADFEDLKETLQSSKAFVYSEAVSSTPPNNHNNRNNKDDDKKEGGDLVIGATPLLGQPIRQTSEGLKHVLDRHTINNIARYSNKSKFIEPSRIPSLIKEATHHLPTLQINGNYARIVDAGENIGTNMFTGKLTSTYTVITKPNGDLVTAFPGKP